MFHHPIRQRVRLFFGFRPPREIAARACAAFPCLGDKGLPADRLHMTLFILDDRNRAETRLIDSLLAVGAAVRADPVAIRLARLIASSGWSALVPGRSVPELIALHRSVAGLARAAGVAEMEGRTFTPHVTLGYAPTLRAAGAVEPVAWTADELLLFHSHLGATKHEVIGRWPLAPPADPQLALF